MGTGGKVFVSPGGDYRVRIYDHGFVEPVGEIPKKIGKLIEQCSQTAIENMPKDSDPEEIFEFMGWTEE